MSALTPVYTVGDQIAEAIEVHNRDTTRSAARARAVELLDLVGIAQPERRARAFPHELSGGERQRVVIAIAIANDPDLLICDEPTTALDVTVQAQILEVLKTARDVTGAGVLIITHDLGVVAEFADRALVMYAGRAVEVAAVGDLYRDRRMPYTAGLLGSVPRLDAPQGARLVPIPGAPPSLAALPPGCPFAPRCPLAIDDCRDRRAAIWSPVGAEPSRRLHPHRAGRRAQRRRHLRRLHRAAPPRTRRRPTPPVVLRVRRPGQDLQTDQGCGAAPHDRRGAGGRRHQLRTPAGPHAGHRRRVGVGQIDDPASDPGPDRAAVGFHRGARRRRGDAGHAGAAGAARRPAGGVPGSGGVAGPTAPRLRSARRAVGRQRFRQDADRRPGFGAAGDRRACAAPTPAAIRPNSPAARSSASASPARWRCSPRSWRSTNRCRRSTCRSRPASSTCCWTCRTGSGWPTCSSPTTCRWSSTWPTGWR